MTFLQAVIVPLHIGMVKGGSDQKGVGLSYNLVTNMKVDNMSDPDNVVSAQIKVPDYWPSYEAAIYAQVAWTGGFNPKVGVRIYRNGSTLVTGSVVQSGTAFASTIITVNAGDTFYMHWQGEGSLFNYPTCKANNDTMIYVTPLE